MEKRPVIPKAKVNTETSQEESFQNTVLRPIVKMKHDLLIKYMKHYIINKNQDFTLLNQEKKLQYLSSCFEKDQTLRSELRGLIIGHFTVEEYERYSEINNAINKRIANIIKERMIDYLDTISN